MSYARSPRPVDSITIGTSISSPFPHSCPDVGLSSALGRIEMVRVFTTRTDDTENRGSSRCGFWFVSYRGPHPVSNALVLLRTSVLIVWPALPVRDRPLHR